MRRVREPARGQVTVHWAVNGTLPNGSDLQPLARPADLRLDVDQQRTLSAFTHAAWRACEVREARYFAFFPLDDAGALWSLSRVTRLDRGARGWVLVAWSAVIPREALDAIAWPAHRLLPTAFPAPSVPARGETYGPVQVDLAPASNPVTDAWRPAMDGLVAGFGRRPPRVALRVTPPLTAEGAIFGLWSRLGKRRADLSFCTWSGVESPVYPPLDRPFHVVVAEGDAVVQARPGRVERTLAPVETAVRPSLADEVLAILDGIEFPPRAAPSADPAADAAEVGAQLFAAYGEALARDARAVFAELADGLARLDDSFAPARDGLFELLALAAGAAEAGRPRARMIADVQAVMSADAPSTAPIATAALRAGAVPYLAAEQWASLGPTLFAQAPGDMATATLRALTAAPAEVVDWGAVLAAAPRGEDAAPLLRLIAARAWDDPAGQAAFDRLSAIGPHATAALAEDPDPTPRVRRQVLARLCRDRRRPRRDLAGLVAYQRYCLWLHRRAHAALAPA